uniref:Polyprotein of PvEV-1 n=1 Tax=Phaseolus vulgaris alphaendornavirus 1 TaxID=1188792 RepID=A0A386QWQ5_9VIRU|nr:polyprotein of PvEV-1 [Phaseolus vulgaris alphaendornavirus 1]
MAPRFITCLNSNNQAKLTGPRKRSQILKSKRRKHTYGNARRKVVNKVLKLGYHSQYINPIPQPKQTKPSIKQLGWVGLSKNRQIKQNANPYVRSIRKLFRSHKRQLIDENRLASLPARKEDLTMGFMFMSALEDKIAVCDLDPKIIGKLNYLVCCMGMGLMKDPSVSLNTIKGNIKHSYITPLNGGTRYNKFEDYMWSEDQTLTIVEGEGNCTEDFLKLIGAEMNKFGGIENYIMANCKARPDAMSNITRTNTGKSYKYDVVPCGMVPIKVCQLCGQINTYSHYEGHPNKGHYSIIDKKFPSGYEADLVEHDEMRTEIRGGQCEVQWRCCHCMGDLNLGVVGLFLNFVNLIKTVYDWMFVIRGNLDELLKSGYGDVYDDLELDQRQLIRNHDMQMIHEYFFHLNRKIIPCGHDTTEIMKSSIRAKLDACEFKHYSNYNSIKPELILEVSALTTVCLSRFKECATYSLGDILPHNRIKNYHQWYKYDGMFPIDNGEECTCTTQCQHHEPGVIFGSIMTCGLNLSYLLAITEKQGQLGFIIPKLTSTKTMADGTGKYNGDGESLELFLDGNPCPLIFKTDTFVTLSNSNIIVQGGKYFMISKVIDLELLELKMITGPYDELSALPLNKINTYNELTVTVNLPSPERLLGKWVGLNFQPMQVNINPSLFRALCIRNLSGKMSHEGLKEYSVGFALRKFVVHNKTISNPSVQYELLDIHIILSRICMMIMKLDYSNSLKYTEWSQLLGPLRGLTKFISEKLLIVITGCFMDYMSASTGLTSSMLIELLKNSHISTWVEGLCKDQFWDNLLKLATDYSVEQLRVINVQEDDATIPDSFHDACKHHNQSCKHKIQTGKAYCKCCGLSCTNPYCECCQPKPHDNTVMEWLHRDVIDEPQRKRIAPLKVNGRDLKVPKEDKMLDRFVQAFEDYKRDQPIKSAVDVVKSIKASHKGAIAVSTVANQSQPWPGIISNKESTEEQSQPAVQTSTIPILADSNKITEPSHQIPTEDTGSIPHVADQLSFIQTIESIDAEDARMKWFKQTPLKVPKHVKLNTQLESVKSKVNADLEMGDYLSVALKLGEEFLAHVLNPVNFEAERNDHTGYLYIMSHILVGINILNPNDFEVVGTPAAIPNTDDLSCGYDALRLATNLDITMSEFQMITGKKPPFSDGDINVIAQHYKLNIILKTDRDVQVMKYDSGCDSFACMVLVNSDHPDDIGHFSACNLRRVKCTNQYFCHKNDYDTLGRKDIVISCGIEPSELYFPTSITKTENIKCEAVYYYATDSTNPVVNVSKLSCIKIGDGWYLTTNEKFKVHNINKNSIYLRVPAYLESLSNSISLALKGEFSQLNIPEMYHSDANLPTTSEEVGVDMVSEVLRSMRRIMACEDKLDATMIKQTVNGRVSPWMANNIFIPEDGVHLKLKLWDKVILRVGKKLIMASVLGIDKTKVTIDTKFIVSTQAKLFELKESYGSCIRALVACCRPLISMSEFQSILDKATLTLGPAGFGKSTAIAAKCSDNDLCVAMTSTSVESLKSKIKNKVRVMTVEKALYSHATTASTLYIDEAMLVPWQVILLLCAKGTTLSMFGAKNQIANVDMSSSPGIRHVVNIDKLIKASNITEQFTTYRIGTGLFEFIKPLEPGLLQGSDHRTSFSVTILDPEQFGTLSNIYNRKQYDVVITPYNYNKMAITNLLGSASPVVTTHSFQGQEVNSSLVVLKADKTGKWDLNSDPRYLNAALTRAKYNCDIVIFSHMLGQPNSVNDLLSQVGGREYHDENVIEFTELAVEDVIVRNDDSPINIDAVTHLSISSMHQLSDHDIQLLNELDLEQQGVNLKYKKLGAAVICEATKAGMLLAKVTNKGGNITIEASNMIKSLINNNLHKQVKIPMERLLSRTGMAKTHKVTLSTQSACKLRELLWIVDKTKDGILTLPLNDGLITITKTSGCPLFAGCKMQIDDEWIYITDAWQAITSRTITYNFSASPCKLNDILIWMQLELPNIHLIPHNGTTWLDVIKGNLVTTYWQATERLTQVKYWMLNALAFSENPKCYGNNLRNVSKTNKFMRKLKIKGAIDYHQSVINHKTLILLEQGWFKSYVTLCSEDGSLISIHKTSKDLEIKEFIVEALQDIQQSEEADKIKGNDIGEMDIPGLLMPMSLHKQKRTPVYQYAVNELGKVISHLGKVSHDLIRVNRVCNQLFRHDITDKYPQLTISIANYHTVLSDVEQILEQVLINFVGKAIKGSKELIVYGGTFPLGVAICGRYYVQLRLPKNSDQFKYHYNEQLPEFHDLKARFVKNKTHDQHETNWDEEHSVDRLLLGLSLYQIPENELLELLNKSTSTIGWVPATNSSGSKFIKWHGNNSIMYRGAEYSVKVNNSLVNRARNGAPMFVDPITRTFYEINVLSEFMDHKLLLIVKRQFPTCNYVNRCIGSMQPATGYRTITVPWVNTNISSIISTGVLLHDKVLRISEKLLRSMLMRLATGDDSEESILAYARSLETTQIITDKSMHDMYGTEIPVLLSTAWYALYIHRGYNYKFKFLVQTINMASNNPLVLQFVSQLLPGVISMMGKVGKLVEDIAQTLLSAIEERLKVNNVFCNCKMTDVDFGWQLLEHKPHIIKYDLLKSDHYAAFYNDDDGGDDPDDYWLSSRTIYEAQPKDEVEGSEQQANLNVSSKQHVEQSGEDKPKESNLPENPSSIVESEFDEFHDAPAELGPDNPVINDIGPNYIELEQQHIEKVWNENHSKKEEFLKRCHYEGVENLNDIKYLWSIECGKHFVNEQANDVQCNNYYKIKPPTNTILNHAGKSVQRIIWCYWADGNPSKFVSQCIFSMANNNPNYRLVLIDDNMIKSLVKGETFECFMHSTAAFRSDLLRLYLLSKFSGVWIDASTIIEIDIEEYCKLACEHDSGVFQFSLCSRSDQNKTYESWFLVATQENKLLRKWYEITLDMHMNTYKFNRSTMSYLAEKYGQDLVTHCSGAVNINLREYLRVYITEKIALHLTDLHSVNCICDDEAKLTIWHKNNLKDWLQFWNTVANTTINDLTLSIGLYKFIGSTRAIVNNGMNYKTITKGSLLSKLLTYIPVKYNIKTMERIIFNAPSLPINLPPKVSLYQKTNCVLLCLGSTGDMIPYLVCYDYLAGHGNYPLLISHKDHEVLVKGRRFHGLSIKSEDVMGIAMNLLYEKEITSSILGYHLMRNIAKETIEILNLYKSHNIKLYIYNPLYPAIQAMKSDSLASWVMLNPFPPEWIVGDRPESTWNKFKTNVAKWIVNLSDTIIRVDLNLPEHQSGTYQELTPMVCCPAELLPINDISNVICCGSLTMLNYYTDENFKTNFDSKAVLVSFGSCNIGVDTQLIIKILLICIKQGYKVIFHDGTNRAKFGTTINQFLTDYRGNVLITKSVNYANVREMVNCCIIHGGIGTLTEALANDITPIIYPIIADQHYWANKVKELGYGGVINKENYELELPKLLTLSSKFKVNRARDNFNISMLSEKLDNVVLSSNINNNIYKLTEDNCSRALMRFDFDGVKHCLKVDLDSIGYIRSCDFNYSILYDPPTTSHCIRACMEYIFDSKAFKTIELCKDRSVQLLLGVGCSKADLVNGILSLGLNLAIVESDVRLDVYKYFESPTVTLRIKKTGANHHCQVVNVTVINNLEYLTTLSRVVNSDEIHSRIIRTINDNKLSYSHMINIHMLLGLQKEIVRRDVNIRLRLDNLQHLMSRGDLNVVWLPVHKHRSTYFSDMMMPDKPLSLAIVTGTNKWEVVVFNIMDNVLLIHTSADLPSQLIFVNLHKTLIETKKPATKITYDIDEISLNKETVDYCYRNLLVPRSQRMSHNTFAKYSVIVSSYDNRSHHMHDELSILKQALQVKFHSKREVTLDQFLISHNEPINRLVLINAELYYNCEFENFEDANLMCQYLNGILHNRNNVLLKSAATDHQVKFLDINFKRQDRKLVRRLHIDENFVDQEITSETLKDLLMNLREHDSIISSQINEMFSNLPRSLHISRPPPEVKLLTDTPEMNLIALKTQAQQLIFPAIYLLIRKVKHGGATINQPVIDHDRDSWQDPKSKQLSKPGNWWNLTATSANKKYTRVSTFEDVMCMNYLWIHDPVEYDYHPTKDSDPGIMNVYIAPYTSTYTGTVLEPLSDLPDFNAINLWSNSDLTDWLSLYSPINHCTIKMREIPTKIKTVEKVALTKYPIRSRAVLTKVCFEEGRSIIGRLKSVAFIRTITPAPKQVAIDLANTYFRSDWRAIVNQYQCERLIIKQKDVEQWIDDNKDCPKIVKELLQLLSGELCVKHISNVNVHLKLESLLKDNPIDYWRQQQARIIVWQRKAVCAVYTSVFVEAKRRLKAILHDKIVYADGLRPDELSARLRLCNSVAGFFENDLTKQDRQTDKPIIDAEMIIYDMLGVHANVIASWREMHETWMFKSDNYWGTGQAMRLTGQATTAIGNVLTNMQVHAKFIHKHWNILEVGLFLGDDMCLVFKHKPSYHHLKNDIATMFNMQSKESWNSNYGTFCSMLCTKLPQCKAEMCPDFVRLKFRYEVTNGVHECTNNNIIMRKASYLMMLGDLPEVRNLIRELELPIKPVKWYNYHCALTAAGHKYDMHPDQVEGTLHQLLHLIKEGKLHKYTFRLFESGKHH